MSFKRSIERNHKTQITHKQFEQETRSQSDFNLTCILNKIYYVYIYII